MRMSCLRRWLPLALLLPLFAMGQGATVKPGKITAELIVHAPEGVAPGKLGSSLDRHPACPALAHLLEEPG